MSARATAICALRLLPGVVGFPVAASGKVDPKAVRGRMHGGGQPLIVHTGDGNIVVEKR